MSLYLNKNINLLQPDLEEMQKFEPFAVEDLMALYASYDYLSTACESLQNKLDNDKSLLQNEVRRIKKEIEILSRRAEIVRHRANSLSLEIRIYELIHTYNLTRECEE